MRRLPVLGEVGFDGGHKPAISFAVSRRKPVEADEDEIPDSGTLPIDCCLYSANALLGSSYTNSDLTATIFDVLTAATLIRSGSSFTDGTTTVSLGAFFDWERNGTPYGDCLITGDIEDQFPSPITVTDGVDSIIVPRVSICKWEIINVDGAVEIQYNTSFYKWAIDVIMWGYNDTYLKTNPQSSPLGTYGPFTAS